MSSRLVSLPPRGRRPRRTPRSASTTAGPSSSTASWTVRADRARAGRYARAAARWARLLVPRRSRPGVRVFYGHDRVPEQGEAVAGGSAKFQRLATRFPNHPTDFTLLYLGSTWLPRDTAPLLRLARRRRIPVVVNQSGVAYPGWAGTETDAINRQGAAASDRGRSKRCTGRHRGAGSVPDAPRAARPGW